MILFLTRFKISKLYRRYKISKAVENVIFSPTNDKIN